MCQPAFEANPVSAYPAATVCRQLGQQRTCYPTVARQPLEAPQLVAADGRAIFLEAIVLKAIVISIVLIVSTSIHAQAPKSAWEGVYQPPTSAWEDSYQPPKSQWRRPNTYQPPTSAWNGAYQPPTSAWRSPNAYQPPKSAWTDR